LSKRSTASPPISIVTNYSASRRRSGERAFLSPSNIAEGKRRKRQLVYLNHLDIALGSQGELEVQLEIAQRIGFLSSHDYGRIQPIVEEVGRMLNGLITAVQPPASNG
jgi:four helix bundle protein